MTTPRWTVDFLVLGGELADGGPWGVGRGERRKDEHSRQEQCGCCNGATKAAVFAPWYPSDLERREDELAATTTFSLAPMNQVHGQVDTYCVLL